MATSIDAVTEAGRTIELAHREAAFIWWPMRVILVLMLLAAVKLCTGRLPG